MRRLLDQLALVEESENIFIGPASLESHVRSFGGQIVAQSLMAVGHTVKADRLCHSLHSYFLRPGATDAPMTFTVDRVRDGRSFSMRRVDVEQNGRLIYTLMASFHHTEAGSEHSTSMPAVPAPLDLPSFEQQYANGPEIMARWFDRIESFDVRRIGPTPFDDNVESVANAVGAVANAVEAVANAVEPVANVKVWVRCKEALGDLPLLHQSVAAYFSDLWILDPILLAHGRRWTDSTVMGASLDHSIWFHRDFDAMDWLLFDQWSDVAAHSRGLAHANVWNQSGQLVATIAQEALLRPPHSIESAP